MLNWFLNWISGDYNKKKIKEFMPLVHDANHRCQEYNSLSIEDFPKKTQEFKDRILAGTSLDDLLPEAFGLVKQACQRLVGKEIEVKGQKVVWDMVPYDVQLLGGIVLHKGIISEMKTGEGKTLVAVAPVYLNALESKGVHVVTVNDYLASRDSDWMKTVYNFLGLTVGCVTKKVSLQQRREMYSCDITYVENSELGFDFLRDNLVKSIKERNLVFRPLNYAIVDEIDSILVDEARTPLIISEPSGEATEKYVYYAQIVNILKPCTVKKKVSKGLLNELLNSDEVKQEEDGDYYIDEKTKTVALSGQGIKKIEEILKVENLYKDIGYEEIHHIENALRAQAVYQADKEYIVVNGEVLIVDEHTGRTMQGRRFSEGLHQAIEAKEKVNIQRESKTLATITYQNFFKQYKKLAGMTGTATTEGEEFEKIYNLSVLEIPTNKPTIRIDKNDKVYFNQAAKWKFVKEHIKFAHEIGQPILIGTSSIDTSEYVSKILEKERVVHNVLNAKYHEQEANIVSQSGKYRNVVVATNMAGRGTDIKLEKGLNDKLADNYADWIINTTKEQGVSVVIYSDVEYNLTIDGLMRKWGLTETQIQEAQKSSTEHKNIKISISFNKRKKEPTDAFAEMKFTLIDNPKADIIEKDFYYGLFILGTEKHESRRIDNQLRGRAGRQGDPGVSVFFVALDDLIMRKMGGERIQSMASLLLGKEELESMELSQKQFTSSIVRAQKQMEAWHFGTRKQVFEYDSVINKQRQAIYKKRDDILFAEGDQISSQKLVNQMLLDLPNNVRDVVAKQIETAQTLGQSIPAFLDILFKELSISIDSKISEDFAKLSFTELEEPLVTYVMGAIMQKLEKINDTNPEMLYTVFKDVFLYHLDTLWIKHIDEMEYLRDKVGLMGYAQIDPLVVYKKEAFEKFQNLLWRLKSDVTTYLSGFDFEGLSKQVVRMESKNQDQDYVQLLQSASNKSKDFVHNNPVIDAKKVVYQNEDGFEVFEVNDGEIKNKQVSHKDNKASEYEKIFASNSVDTKKAKPNDPCPCGSGKKYKKCCGAI